ncbi:hypothetical protein GCM10010216_69820 [Streptomyces flaveolus]|nr:hypothetical protein GCM10010216_69820 [Streptomyces flaveolus]
MLSGAVVAGRVSPVVVAIACSPSRRRVRADLPDTVSPSGGSVSPTGGIPPPFSVTRVTGPHVHVRVVG